MLNKDKVNEIVADMQEEERLRKEELERQADEFLKDRLEYYVAMVVNKDIQCYSKLKDALSTDINSTSNKDKSYIKQIALNTILESLISFNIYAFPDHFTAHLTLREKNENDTWLDVFNIVYQKNSIINKYIKNEVKNKEEEDPWFDAKRTIQKMHDNSDMKEKMETYKLTSGFLLAFLILALVFIFLLCTHQNVH